MIRYYLGVRVRTLDCSTCLPEGWVWAQWPDKRWWKHWADQLTEHPWGITDERKLREVRPGVWRYIA